MQSPLINFTFIEVYCDIDLPNIMKKLEKYEKGVRNAKKLPRYFSPPPVYNGKNMLIAENANFNINFVL
jgi:hypothetical protein